MFRPVIVPAVVVIERGAGFIYLAEYTAILYGTRLIYIYILESHSILL